MVSLQKSYCIFTSSASSTIMQLNQSQLSTQNSLKTQQLPSSQNLYPSNYNSNLHSYLFNLQQNNIRALQITHYSNQVLNIRSAKKGGRMSRSDKFSKQRSRNDHRSVNARSSRYLNQKHIADAITKMNSSMEKMNSSINRMNFSINRMNSSIKKVNTSLEKISTQLNQLSRLKTIEDGIGRIEDNFRRWNSPDNAYYNTRNSHIRRQQMININVNANKQYFSEQYIFEFDKVLGDIILDWGLGRTYTVIMVQLAQKVKFKYHSLLKMVTFVLYMRYRLRQNIPERLKMQIMLQICLIVSEEGGYSLKKIKKFQLEIKQFLPEQKLTELRNYYRSFEEDTQFSIICWVIKYLNYLDSSLKIENKQLISMCAVEALLCKQAQKMGEKHQFLTMILLCYFRIAQKQSYNILVSRINKAIYRQSERYCERIFEICQKRYRGKNYQEYLQKFIKNHQQIQGSFKQIQKILRQIPIGYIQYIQICQFILYLHLEEKQSVQLQNTYNLQKVCEQIFGNQNRIWQIKRQEFPQFPQFSQKFLDFQEELPRRYRQQKQNHNFNLLEILRNYAQSKSSKNRVYVLKQNRTMIYLACMLNSEQINKLKFPTTILSAIIMKLFETNKQLETDFKKALTQEQRRDCMIGKSILEKQLKLYLEGIKKIGKGRIKI